MAVIFLRTFDVIASPLNLETSWQPRYSTVSCYLMPVKVIVFSRIEAAASICFFLFFSAASIYRNCVLAFFSFLFFCRVVTVAEARKRKCYDFKFKNCGLYLRAACINYFSSYLRLVFEGGFYSRKYGI